MDDDEDTNYTDSTDYGEFNSDSDSDSDSNSDSESESESDFDSQSNNVDSDGEIEEDSSIEIIENINETSDNQPSTNPSNHPDNTANNNEAITNINNVDSSHLSDSEVDNCIICGDAYTNSDIHHIVTLRCGHLFGKSCIERWLAPELRNLRCPTCSRNARRRDIIKIYAQNLRPLDTWKLEECNKKIEESKKKIQKMEMTIQKLEESNRQLTNENDFLKSKLIDFHDKKGGKIDINRFKPPDFFASSSLNSSKRSKKFHISFLKDISFSESGSRYLCYSHISDHLVVNIFNSNSALPSMFPSYGVRMFNLENNSNESLFLHTKAMKGMVVNSSEGTLVTISLDKTMKHSSIFNKAIIDNVQLSNEPWSVTKMPDHNLSCVGYRNSIIDVYDRRKSNQAIFTFKPTSIETATPVASMTVIEYSHNHQRKTALLSMHLDSFWLYLSKDNLITVNEVECFKLPMQGKTLSCDYDKKSGYTMISFRPSLKHQRTTHYILDFEYDDQTSDIVPNIINILEGGNKLVHLSQSRIFTSPNNNDDGDDNDSILVCAPDDNGAMIWDYKKRFTQPIKTINMIHDFRFIPRHQISPNGLLSCLGEKIIKLYKM